MRLRFCPIASGSSGNCVYIGTPRANILIDAGLSGSRIAAGLSRINVSPKDIDAIFVTHDHTDHVKGAGIFSRRHNTPIHATRGTWSVMRGAIGAITGENERHIEAGRVVRINDMEIIPFTIPHDAEEPVGFSVLSCGVKATIATDLGYAAEDVFEMLKNSEVVLLETNHDVEMLKSGPYPYYLKRRILSDVGHLSNETAGILLSQIVSPKLKHVYLGHLSEENNTPNLAFETVSAILRENVKKGAFTMRCASRGDVSALAEI